MYGFFLLPIEGTASTMEVLIPSLFITSAELTVLLERQRIQTISIRSFDLIG